MVSIKKKVIQFLKFILCPEVSKCHGFLPSCLLLVSIALCWEDISVYVVTGLSLGEC